MNRFKLIALDMDGTLLTDDQRITEETVVWLNRAVDEGIKVLFTTGRGMQTASNYWDELGLESPMVLLNGAEVWRGPGDLHKRVFLPEDEVRSLHKLAMENHADWFWGYSRESLTG
uniref:HAD family hydrolase n=1 Tax=Paenibacillus dakarensis TaxID=1527293 RepID=UPI000A682AB3